MGIAYLRTPCGDLSYTLQKRKVRLELRIDSGLAAPPGGLALPWPYPGKPPATAQLNGKPVSCQNNEIVIRRLPAVLDVARPRN